MTDPATLRLHDAHTSGLPIGDYALHLGQTLAGESGPLGKLEETVSFRAGQRRYRLADAEVVGAFPPDASSGPFARCLPHLLLRSSGLPWEARPAWGKQGTPWLALVLLDEEELTPQTEGRVAVAGEEAPVATVTVPRTLLPSPEAVRLQAHVRQGGGDASAFACLFGHRLPRPGHLSVVHLVALDEGPHGPIDLLGASETVTLYSLLRFAFRATQEAPDFSGRVRRLDAAMIHSGTAEEGPEAAGALMRGAWVPLRHVLRDGAERHSLYRGPLIPFSAPPPEEPPLPVSTADQLLRLHPGLGLLDVTYAAAWSLGRSSALSSRTLCKALSEWGRARARRHKAAHVARTLEGRRVRLLRSPAALALTPLQPSTGLPAAVKTAVAAWMKGDGLPLNYLVPTAAQLPAESIRFFRLDGLWLKVFLNGVLQAGLAGETDPDTAGALWTELWEEASQGWPPGGRTGFLLRSTLPGDFPALEVTGDADVPCRLRRAGDVLLGWFDGPVSSVTFGLPHRVMHAAFEPGEAPGALILPLREVPGVSPAALAVPMTSSERRTVDLPELAKGIAKHHPAASTGPALLGFHLLQAGEGVRIGVTGG